MEAQEDAVSALAEALQSNLAWLPSADAVKRLNKLASHSAVENSPGLRPIVVVQAGRLPGDRLE